MSRFKFMGMVLKTAQQRRSLTTFVLCSLRKITSILHHPSPLVLDPGPSSHFRGECCIYGK